jgi:transposase
MKGELWMDIRADYKKGLKCAELGRKYGIDPRTAKKYAEAESRPKYELSKKRGSILDKYKPTIDELLKEAAYSAVRIQEKITDLGYTGKYTIVKRYVSSKKAEYNHQATIRFETMPGLQGQVDWAHFPDYQVYKDGRYKKLYCFLMILGFSRARYIEFVTEMSTDTLLRCHNNAFRYFKGYPEEILYDNMKQVVVKRLIKQSESTLNSQFEDFAGFYGFKPVLCRPYRGQTKGKIERTVSFVRNNLMVGIKYETLDDLNNQAYAWCDKVNSKVHATTNKIPFEELNKENLNPLKREFMMDKVVMRKIGKDCLISYNGNKYSVPSRYAGKEGAVRIVGGILMVYRHGELIAQHRLDYSKNSTNVNPAHYKELMIKQSFDTKNTIFDDIDILHTYIPQIDLNVYDLEGH